MVENEEITGTMRSDGEPGDLVADFIGMSMDVFKTLWMNY